MIFFKPMFTLQEAKEPNRSRLIARFGTREVGTGRRAKSREIKETRKKGKTAQACKRESTRKVLLPTLVSRHKKANAARDANTYPVSGEVTVRW